jgi:hypothetical protein
MTILSVLAVGILLAHLATLRLLLDCRKHATGFTDTVKGETVDMGLRMEELCRIGSDVADTLEGIMDGASAIPSLSAPQAPQEFDVKSTIASLLLEKFMAQPDGLAQQEGTIYGTETKKNESTSEKDDQ